MNLLFYHYFRLAVQHERGPRKPKLHNALLAGGSHQNHLQLQGLVTSVSAYAHAQTTAMNAGHSSGFHPVIPHIHHPQPLPFSSIVHASHHPHAQNHHAHHHSHLLPVPQSNGDFYKNAHLGSNVMMPNVLTHPMPLLASTMNSHMSVSIQPQTPISTTLTSSISHIPSNHSTISTHQSHYSPKSNASSTIEPSHDSISPPLIVDNIDSVASPISVSSNSNNNNNINSNNNHKNMNNIVSSPNNNNNGNENTIIKSNGDVFATNSNIQRNGLRSEQNNSLLDILMNPDKCQVNRILFILKSSPSFHCSLNCCFLYIFWEK